MKKKTNSCLVHFWRKKFINFAWPQKKKSLNNYHAYIIQIEKCMNHMIKIKTEKLSKSHDDHVIFHT